ncbi:kinesin-domain-containing protein [Boletus coccyginus]|nr:kinesin-domain-containing protein [Boletus coccyginus]
MNKRKLPPIDDDDDNDDQPRKLPAIGTNASSHPSRQKPRPPCGLTQPDPPKLTVPRRTTRATSAPPKPSAAAARSRGRITSGSMRTTDTFRDLKNQITSLESKLDAERAKVAEIQADHRALYHEFASSREAELDKRRQLIRQLSEDLRVAKGDLDRERASVASLKSMVSNQSAAQITLNAQMNALQTEKNALQAQLDTVASTASQQNLDHESALRRIAFLEQEAREAETVRRKLHNMVQELKGNIRVFCRVRPALVADIAFPDKRDHKEIVLTSSGSSAMGQERKEVYAFSFDRVFEPESTQTNVFEEISLLAQSCVDGYNVCIFAYGQTGSGKSFTMEGGSTEATVGMIPRAVNEVFRAADALKNKGWEYSMEGQFLEIIKHEKTATSASTRVTDVNVIPLRTPREVSALLRLANSRRTVAATLMNERSSRSHSVFTLRISGCNKHTGERCEGSLNLVDLAGSERLNSSGVAGDKERLKETQNINRSLSALGDVIAALGEKGEKGEKHIPYRNSKLTYLLQYSLSGHSKTLMILNLSPLAAHLNESLTSLRFATKVNNTTVGPAKKQVRGAS